MKQIRAIRSISFFPAIILLIVLGAAGVAVVPYFTQFTFISSVCRSNAPMIILCLGQAIVIICGGIDISIGATASLGSAVIAYLYGAMSVPLPLALLCSIVVGLFFGLLNGLVIGYFRVNSLITTFAISWISGELALWLLPDATAYPLCNAILPIYKSSVLGIPLSLLLVVLLVVIWQIICRTPFGDHIYAVGNHFHRAYISGVNVQKVQVGSYLMAGVCAGVAGICIFASVGRGDVSVGDSYTLQTIAACVIGGISLAGGIGQAVGAVLGGYFIAFLYSLILAFNISAYYQGVINDLVIILGILIPSVIHIAARRRKGGSAE